MERLPENLRNKITPSANGCWEWTACKNRDGYGRVKWKGRVYLAHVLVHLLLVGEYPPGTESCHACDNPACVRPHEEHNRPCTKSKNLQEAYDRNRKVKGEEHFNAKLTEADVAAIRARYAQGGINQTQLGEQYGVSHQTISRVVCGASYRG